ncbi:MAG TPA: malonic semialdehyde reductase [Rhodospirillaceae bacterium]|nr:malonic semialdehyde reductase [Rhodospirillaceae bacterium]HAT34302.1 malonic semialdehyde reductase [Rhodospirillaceae bacterium]
MSEDQQFAAEAAAALKQRVSSLDDNGLDLLFREARSLRAWTDAPVSDELLHQLHDVFIMAPTANNAQPVRVLYVKSDEAKKRLIPCLNEGNVEKTMTAPATAIIGHDLAFHETFDELSGREGGGARFADNAAAAETFAFRNGSLQGGYFMLAVRALGLDVGPMSGFNNEAVDKEFFAGTEIKSNFLCNIGYGDPSGMRPRGRRFAFNEISEIL